MITEEEWLISRLKCGCVWVIHISGAGKERYAALCAGCEDSEKNRTSPSRSLRRTV